MSTPATKQSILLPQRQRDSHKLDVEHAPQAKILSIAWKITIGTFALAGFWGLLSWSTADTDGEVQEITATVVRANLSIVVTERGELESSNTVDVRCEVEGRQNKIVEIVPEGTHVTEGQFLVRFDTDELSRLYAEQEIKVKQAEAKALAGREDLEVQTNKAESEIATKKLELDLAELDKEKYLKGDFKVEEDDIKGAIALAERDLQEATEKLEHYRRFVKKGFGTPAQLRLKEQEVERTKYYLERDRSKLEVLQKFTRRRQEVELTAKAEEAAREWERTKRTQEAETAKAKTDLQAAEITARLEKAQLDKLQKQLEHCTINAPQDGIIVYSKDRYWDPNSRIREGGVVHFQQRILSLPDLTKMQATVKIHESNVKKVRPQQKAELRVDAYPDQVLRGTVESVATIADSRRPWDEGGVKEYVTIVKIDDLPEKAALKPGMTAEVRVFVDELSDVLLVPVQAVAERKDQHYAYVRGANGFQQRRVEIGGNSESFVEIHQGLEAGDEVALDARLRLKRESSRASRGAIEIARVGFHR